MIEDRFQRIWAPDTENGNLPQLLWQVWWWGVAFEGKKAPSPIIGKGALQLERVLVVVLLSRELLVEFARRANRAFTRIRPGISGGLVPVEMVDGVRVFGVGFAQFAGSDLCLLPEPARPQGLDLRAGCSEACVI